MRRLRGWGRGSAESGRAVLPRTLASTWNERLSVRSATLGLLHRRLGSLAPFVS